MVIIYQDQFCNESTPDKVAGVRNQSFSTCVIKLDEINDQDLRKDTIYSP